MTAPPAPVAPAQTTGSVPAADGLEELRARWGALGQVLLQMGAPLLAAALSDSLPLAVGGDQLTIEAPAGRVPLLTDPEQQRVVGNACLAAFGSRYRLVVKTRLVKGGPQPAITDERQRRYLAAQEHPIVRELMRRFEADLVGRELVDLQTWLQRLASEREAAPRRRFHGDLGSLGDRGEEAGDG